MLGVGKAIQEKNRVTIDGKTYEITFSRVK